MDNRVDGVFVENMENQIFATDISLDEFVSWVGRHVFRICTIIQTINVDYTDIRVSSENVIDEVGTDKSTATGH